MIEKILTLLDTTKMKQLIMFDVSGSNITIPKIKGRGVDPLSLFNSSPQS